MIERDEKGRFKKKEISVDVLFKNRLEANIDKLEYEIDKSVIDEESYRQSFVNIIQRLEIQRSQLEDMKRFVLNVNDNLNKGLEEIKSLSFVKSVKIDNVGINVDVGQIYVQSRGRSVYIGDFDIIITPEKVKICNRNPICITYHNGEKYYLEHPHINNGNVCYGGERALKVNEYFAKFELKKLVYFVYLFLKSYNQIDKYESISNWTKKDAKHKYPVEEKQISN